MSTKPDEDESFSDEIAKPLESEANYYARILHEEQYIYGAYGFFDGLNLALTIPKLLFDESYINASDAAEALHHWMATPLGIAIMVVESIALVTFSVFGSILDDEDENPIKRYVAILWPYVRDLLKALKWAYKGIRATFIALCQLLGTDIRALILPFAILFGAVSVFNRIWQRMMREERKAMMKLNATLQQDVVAKGCNFHILSEIPDFSHKVYANSYVLVKGIPQHCGLLWSDAPPTPAIFDKWPKKLDGAYVRCENAIYYVDKITQEITLKCNNQEGIEHFDRELNYTLKTSRISPLTTDELKKIQTTIGSNEHLNEKKSLLYIDAEGKSKSVQVKSLHKFDNYLNNILKANLLDMMRIKLHQSNVKQSLHFAPKFKELYAEEHFLNSYIYITNEPKIKDKLFYVDQNGTPNPAEPTLQAQFEKDFLEVKTNINLIGPSNEQLQKALLDYGHTPETKLGLDIDEWTEYRKEVELKLEQEGRQNGFLPALCYVSAIFSGFIDSLYFYMGALGLAYFVPPLFMAMMVVSTVFAFLYIVSKIYEEYDFQRKLKATETRVRLALCVKEIDLLVTELTKTGEMLAYGDVNLQTSEQTFELNTDLLESEEQTIKLNSYIFNGKELDLIKEANSGQSVSLKLSALQELKNQIVDLIKSNPDATQLPSQIQTLIKQLLENHQDALAKRLLALLAELEKLNKKLNYQVSHSYATAALEGLRNGLAVQGILISCMLVTATILLILATPCPAAVVIGCAAAGITALITMITHALYIYHTSTYKTPINPPNLKEPIQGFLTNLKLSKENALTTEKPEPAKIRAALYNKCVEPGLQFSIMDICDMFRYFGSGGVKGWKFEGEITGEQPNSFFPLLIGGLLAFITGVVFSLRSYARSFGRPAVDSISTKSATDVKFFPETPPPSSGTDSEKKNNPATRLTSPPVSIQGDYKEPNQSPTFASMRFNATPPQQFAQPTLHPSSSAPNLH